MRSDGPTGAILLHLFRSGTIDCIVGGLGGLPECDYIQLRYVHEVGGLSGTSSLNDSVLAEIAPLAGFDGVVHWEATLTAELVFGVDPTGFYLLDESQLWLDIDANGSVNGHATVFGQSIAVDGTVFTDDLQVVLTASGGDERLRIEDFDGTPAFTSLFELSASGDIDVTLNLDTGPLDLQIGRAHV